MQTLKIGSRESRLAIVQAQQVMESLGVPCELITMKTTGDRILDRTLDQVGGKGLFVKELDHALAAHTVDFTVHSLKDVPMEQPEGLPLVAFSAREDARDVLVLPKGCTERNPDLPIGCSSARRRVQLGRLFPDATVEPVRGNLQTRLRKLDSGAYGALVLAAAGLHRLGLQERISRYFAAEEMIPAAGQGILAVQGRMGESSKWMKKIDNADARICAMAERAYVRALGGSCFAPVAAYAVVESGEIRLSGMYATEDEQIVVYGDVTGAKENAEALGQTLAKRLKQQAEEKRRHI